MTIAVEAADFEFHGDWSPSRDKGNSVLVAATNKPVHPAATAVALPRAGRYRLWVCTRDFPDDRPGTRTFAMTVAGRRSDKTFGASGQADYG